MTPALPGLALAVAVLVAVRGWVLVRDTGVASPEPEIQPRRRLAAPFVTRLVDRLERRLTAPATRLLGPTRLERTRQLLDAAGRPGGLTPARHAGRRAAHAVLLGAIGIPSLLGGQPLPMLMLTAAGWVWSDVWLLGVARRRQAQIERSLPDFLDVLAVTVAAGMAFQPALARVSAALGGPLGEEIDTALHQLDLGMSRRAAFTELRDRNRSDTLASFVTALLQAEELGSPLAATLVDLARDMRRAGHQEARRKAARAAPRISLIVSTIVVPGAITLILTGLFISSGVDLGEIGGS